MISPINIKHVEDTLIRKTEDKLNELEISSIDTDDELVYDIYNSKSFRKYIDSVKKEVRKSFEYQRCIQYLKDYMGMNESAFIKGINNKDYEKVKIELHHSPLTLEDIALIVFNKRLYNKESIEVQQVAKEITKLHYYLVVGLVALTKTEHQLVHNQFLFVPADKVLGNWGKFISYYKKFMTPEQNDTIDLIEEYTMDYNQAQNEIVLQNNVITLDTSKAYETPDMGKLKIAMSNKIEQIKSNGYQLLTLDEEKLSDEDSTERSYNIKQELKQAVKFNNLRT